MRVTSSVLQKYYQSLLGNRIREKVTDKVWTERTELETRNVDHISPQILPADRFSLLRSLISTAKETPHNTFFISNGKIQTASKTFSNVKRIANGLRNLGVNKGDKVAIMALPHEKELYETFFATQAIGAIPVLINFLNPPETIAYMFARSDAKTLFVGSHYKLRAGATKLASLGMFENVITCGETDYRDLGKLDKKESKTRNVIANSIGKLFFYNYDSLLRRREIDEDEILVNPNRYAPALQLFTSGTSKRPRIMTYTNEMFATSFENTSKRFNFTKNDIWLLPVPFYHLAGLIIFAGAVKFKSPLVLTEIPRYGKPETISAALENIERNHVTILPGIPRVIEPILEAALNKGSLLPDLRFIFSGGSPMTPKLVILVNELNKRREEKGVESVHLTAESVQPEHLIVRPIHMTNLLASTECGPISATINKVTLDNIDSLGVPFEGVEVKIYRGEMVCSPDYPSELTGEMVCSPDYPSGLTGEMVCSPDHPSELIGELLVRVPNFPPEITGDLLTEDGYFKTGDQVRIENNGSLAYVGRLTEILNVNGEKISPVTIQEKIKEMPGVKESLVFGVTKPNDGSDLVCAIVVPHKGVEIKPDEIKRFLVQSTSRTNILNRAFVPSVIFIEPKGIPDIMIPEPGKPPIILVSGKGEHSRRAFGSAYRERALAKYEEERLQEVKKN